MVLEAATSSEELTLSVPLVVAAAGAALVLLAVVALVAALRRVPRIPSAPAGMELSVESPAVAGMLAAGFVVPAETAPAVLLDLAARRIVELDEVQPGKTICRVRSREPGALSPAEDRVLRAIRGKAIDGVVPTEALTTGTEDLSTGWHRALARDVIAESQGAGLTIDRWPKWVVGILVGGIAVVGMLLAFALNADETVADDDQVLAAVAGGIAVSVIAFGAVFATRLGRSLAQLPTDAGKAAAARVGSLVRHLQENHALADLPPAAVKLRGRHFAYAAIFGAAPLAVALLPMGAEDDHRAWSSFGGRWRRVRVRSPRVWPPAWGRHPGVAALLALVWVVVGALAIRGLTSIAESDRPAGFPIDAWDWVTLAAVIAMIPFGATLAWAVWVLLLALPDLASQRSVHGQIVRDRRFNRRFVVGSDPKFSCYLAVDEGSSDRIRALRLREPLWRTVSQGQLVNVETSPRLGYVRTLKPAATPKP